MRGTSYRQDQQFTETLFDGNNFLQVAIEWIGKNMNPDDVFDEKDLSNWAEENDFTHNSKINER